MSRPITKYIITIWNDGDSEQHIQKGRGTLHPDTDAFSALARYLETVSEHNRRKWTGARVDWYVAKPPFTLKKMQLGYGQRILTTGNIKVGCGCGICLFCSYKQRMEYED